MSVALDQSAPMAKRFTPDQLVGMMRQAQADPAVDRFHMLWYHAPHTWAMTRYCGVPMLKNPLDLQVYHEILWHVKPRLIIETGTCFGGSALWFAHQLERIHTSGTYKVMTIDIEDHRRDGEHSSGDPWTLPAHHAIDYVPGSSIDNEIIKAISWAAARLPPVLVSLDADHHEAHVLAELRAYAPMVTRGSYCVVEDTNVSGRPLVADDPGPGAAITTFLAETPGFQVEPFCERYLMTMHPGGWLRCV